MRLQTMAIVSWLTMVTVASSADIPSDPGHLFIPAGKTYPSYSSWAVTISVNIAPYRIQIRNLVTTARSLSVTAGNLDLQARPKVGAFNASTNVTENEISTALKPLQEVANSLVTEVDDLSLTFSDLLYPQSDQTPNPSFSRRRRIRRGLINGIGKAMSYLFGTATEGEIKHLTNNVQLLNRKDIALAHKFNGTLQMVNATRLATTQNRAALNAVNTTIRKMTSSWANLQKSVDNDRNAAHIALEMSVLTADILQVTQSVRRLYAALYTISDQLALAQIGSLHKSLLSRRDFTRLLRRIDKSLPPNFALPYDASDSQQYIKIARTKLVEVANSYHVLFYIPLLHTLHAFDIYRFFPYQVPLHNHNVSLSYSHSEPNYLLMSENRQHFIQPDQSEIEPCILAKLPYCSLHEPAYSTADTNSCIVALFRRDTTAIISYCPTTIQPSNDAPKSYYLTSGQWLIISKPPVPITIFCASSQKSTQYVIQKQVDIITLEIECSASSDSFYLPPYYASESHLELPPLSSLEFTANISVPIWRTAWSDTLRNVTFRNLSLLPPLHLDGMPADAYFDRLEALPLEQVTTESPSSFSKFWLITIIVGILAFACLVFLCQHCCPLVRSPVFRVRPTPPAPSPSPSAEPAIELQESAVLVSPPPVSVVDRAVPRCVLHPPAVVEDEPSRGPPPSVLPFHTSSLTTSARMAGHRSLPLV